MDKLEKFRSAIDYNDKSHRRNFPDKISYKSENGFKNNDAEKPRDLRERLNKNRQESSKKNFSKASEVDRWQHDLYDEKQKTLKSRLKITDNHENEVNGEVEMKKERKVRPEKRLNIHDAIKISLGLMPRRRREASEVKSIDKVEDKPLKVYEKNIENLQENKEVETLKDESSKQRNSSESSLEFNNRKQGIYSKTSKSNQTKISAEAPEFIPKFHQPVVQTFHEPEQIFLPQVFPIQASKLQSRLDRVRNVQNSKFDVQKEVKRQQYFENPIENTKDSVTNEIENSKTSSQSPKLSQCELDSIAVESLAKLTADQQTHLVYISNVPSKYFQEVYEYFVDYYRDVQCVDLNLAAVEAYLKSQGVAVQKIKPPMPFQHENFSFTKINEPESSTQPKRTKNPIAIVDPNEEEKIMRMIREELEIDQEVDNMFLRRG